MFRIIYCLLILGVSSSQLQIKAQSQRIIELDSKEGIATQGNLQNGELMKLDWATSSSVACFPSTRFDEYKGNHVLYRTHLPAQSKITITVTPKDSKDRINLYALRLGENNNGTPPEIQHAISCEAGYPIYAGTPNLNRKHESHEIEFISIRNGYNIVIGVAGAKNVIEGEYDLKVELESR